MRKPQRVLRALCAVGLLTILWPQSALSESSEELERLIKDVEALKEWQGRVQRELQELKALQGGARAAQPAEPQSLLLSVDGAPFIGEENATLTMIEFSDYQCPFCSRHARDTFPQIEREFVKTGKLKYVIRDFPIESIHPQAFKGHEAAHCAGEQGKYWEMHARLFANQAALSPSDLMKHAQVLKLNLAQFRHCADGGKHGPEIRKALADGKSAGVTGTPTFFLGFTDGSDAKVKAVRMVRGAHPFPAFKEVIEALLASAQK